VHLNDNDGRADAHLPPGSGGVDWGRVGRIVDGVGYRGVWMYEIEPSAEGPSALLQRTMARHRESDPGQTGPAV